VLSGVIQGSVVGPRVCRRHNSLPHNKITRICTNLELLGKEWSMEFNPDKCEVSEYTEKRSQLSSHTHFMTPPSEPQKTQNISGSLSVVTSIGHLT